MKRVSSSFLPPILSEANRKSPLSHQLYGWFRHAIVAGRLRPGQAHARPCEWLERRLYPCQWIGRGSTLHKDVVLLAEHGLHTSHRHISIPWE
jgi:hypothetical protein